MQKKLTVTIDEGVYEGLRKTIGPGKISKFILHRAQLQTLPLGARMIE